MRYFYRQRRFAPTFVRHRPESPSGFLRNDRPESPEYTLLNGNIIEEYPDDQRGYSCLVCGKTLIGHYLHIVCGLSDDILWVVTAYEPERRD